jgi:hypothetical protein
MGAKAKARYSFKLVDGVRMNFLTKHPKVVRNWVGKKILIFNFGSRSSLS